MGNVGSAKLPVRACAANVLSKTSTVPCLKLAASRNVPRSNESSRAILNFSPGGIEDFHRRSLNGRPQRRLGFQSALRIDFVAGQKVTITGIANTGFGGIGDTGQHISGFGNSATPGTLGQGYMSGFFNTATGFTGTGLAPVSPFTNTFSGDVSGIMNHVSGGGGDIGVLMGFPPGTAVAGLNGFTSGYFNTGLPGTALGPLSPFVAGFDSGVNNSGTFVPGLFGLIPTLQKVLG